ncbi:MAG: hemolysin family protein [Pseudomonadota bacterium]
MDPILWLQLILFVVLMGLSGFFSSSETSLFSLNKLQLEQMRRQGNRRIDLIERLLSEPRRLIVTILIGNEFVNVTASVISAAIVIKLFGAENKYMNLFIMVPILLLVGEITPKTLAIRNNEVFATVQSLSIDRFAWLITPLRTAVRLVADWLTTRIVGKERSRGNIITEDLVRTLAYEAVGDGTLDKTEAQYIEHIFEFGEKTLEDVMTPRSHIFFLSIDTPVNEIIAEIHRLRHDKIPIYQGHRDQVLGILYARDLLSVDLSQITDGPDWLLKQLRKPYLVPETKPVVELFRSFRKRRSSLALTIDEYGGITGLITMGDLLECIFGEIPSASEIVEEAELRKRIQGTNRVDASMSVDQFNREFAAQLPTDRSDTLAGLVLHKFGELPPVGAGVVVEEWEFTVVSVEKYRIREVKLERVKTDLAADTESVMGPAEQKPCSPAADVPAGDAIANKKKETGDA